jgi:hypothetical protein
MGASEIEGPRIFSAIEDDEEWKFAAVAERFELLFEAPRRQRKDPLAILRRHEPAAKALKSVGEELLGSVGIAENGVGCIDFASDLVGFDTVLVKVATLELLALGGLLPSLVEAARIRRLQSKLELHRPSLAQQHVVDDGLDDLLRLDWNRHRDAEVVPNLLCLADEHLEDDLVHGIVRAVEQDRLHDRLRLAKPVDPALTLLQPVRIPGQVVMNHGVKIVLKIDALAQAIGGDEYSWITLHQFRDALLPLLIVIFAGDGENRLMVGLDGPASIRTSLKGGG